MGSTGFQRSERILPCCKQPWLLILISFEFTDSQQQQNIGSYSVSLLYEGSVALWVNVGSSISVIHPSRRLLPALWNNCRQAEQFYSVSHFMTPSFNFPCDMSPCVSWCRLLWSSVRVLARLCSTMHRVKVTRSRVNTNDFILQPSDGRQTLLIRWFPL